ncbi:MAG TPA: hypothetical protein VHO50_02920 [Bacteroidales bacterium]|nr:hypothetical protein [Bacteroidales bacterium]
MKNSNKLLLFAGILLLINVLVYTTRVGGDQVVLFTSDALPIICSLVASLCLLSLLRHFKQVDYTYRFWLLLFIGIFLYFIAETIYGVFEIFLKIDMAVNYPSIADYFWCIAYIPMFIGLVMMISGYRRSGFPMGSKKVCFFLITLIIVISSVVSIFILTPIINDAETPAFTKFFYMFYPIGDVLVVTPVILLAYITSLFGKGIVSRPWKYIAIGFICFSIADLLFAYLSWSDSYGNGNLIDLAWNFGYLSIGAAGLMQKELMNSINN